MKVTWIGMVTYNVPHPSTEIILHFLHPATSPLQLIHTHPLPSFTPSLAFLPLLSLHRLFVGSATGVLGLHHIREFWGAGEGLNVQLLKHLIWWAEETRKH